MNNSPHQAKSPAATGLNAETQKETTQQVQCTPIRNQKRLASLRARAAMANVQFHVFPDNDTGQTIFVVSKWAMTRQLESLDAAEAWLDMVCGVKHGL